MLVKPNFFIVGAAKCGTTSLYEYLRPHPQVFMPSVKEPRCFDTDQPMSHGWRIRDMQAYAKLFEGAEGYAAVGEASPTYLTSEVAPKRIAAYQPDARIIISLRDPVDFMYSAHKQALVGLNENIRDFSQALAAEVDRAEGRQVPRSAYFPQALLYRHRARFSQQVQQYFDVFGRDRVLVVLIDDMKRDAAEVYRRVLQFLSLDECLMPDFVTHNQSEAASVRNMTARAFLLKHGGVRKLVGFVPPGLRRMGDLVLELLTRERIEVRQRIDPKLAAQLRAEFAPEVQELGRLIGRDLSAWARGELASPTTHPT